MVRIDQRDHGRKKGIARLQAEKRRKKANKTHHCVLELETAQAEHRSVVIKGRDGFRDALLCQTHRPQRVKVLL